MKKIMFILIFLVSIISVTAELKVVKPAGTYQTIVGSDGFILFADSDVLITGAWDCTSYGNSFDWYSSCNSKYYNFMAEGHASDTTRRTSSAYSAEQALSGYLATISGDDTSITFSQSPNHVSFLPNLKNLRYKVTLKNVEGISFVDSLNSGNTGSQALNSNFGIDGGIEQKISISGTATVELIPSILQEGMVAVLVNEEEVMELDVSSWEGLYLRFIGAATSTNPRFQYLMGCNIAEDEALGVVTYGGGDTISISPLFKLTDFDQTVRNFCYLYPTLIVDTNTGTGGSDISNEIYDALVNGEVLTVPNGESWILFPIVSSSGLTSVCQEGEAVDLSTGECSNPLTVIVSLVGSTVDEETGTATYSSLEICESVATGESGVYFVEDNKCIFYELTDISCIESGEGYVFSAAENGCVQDLVVATITTEEACDMQGEDYYFDDGVCYLSASCDADATAEYDENGNLVKCVKPASKETLEFTTPSTLTEEDCKEKYGDDATVITSSDGEAYACLVSPETVYYCGGVVLGEDEVCANDNADEVSEIVITVGDESDLEEDESFIGLYAVIILILFALILGFFAVKKK